MKSEMLMQNHGFLASINDALAAHELTTIVAKVEAIGPAADVTDLSLVLNRCQFQRALRS